MLRLQDVSENVLEQIKSELTIKNPAYARKKAMGLNRWAWGQEWIKLWSEKVNGWKEYVLPRGYWARLWEIAGDYITYRTDTVLLPEIIYPKTPQLRDYQAPAIEKALSWQQGVIIMGCGTGKTEVGMGIAAAVRQPTLWVTHTMDLLKQSMDRAISRLELTGSQIGVIQGENMSIGTHMTFATVQTLNNRDLTEIKNKFGCVIIDEAHLCYRDEKASRMFNAVVSQFPAFYRFGLTASEYRSDGLIETMFHVIGPKIYEVAQDDPRLSVMKPRVEFIETEFEYEQEDGEMLNVQQMYRVMREDVNRELTLKSILTQKITHADTCLVLGDSLDHLESLRDFVQQRTGLPAAFVCGETSKREREKIMTDMRQGRYQYLFATYALAKLGLDIPRLNKLVLVTPHRDKTSIQQAVGRVMRPYDSKQQPVVYDLYDSRVPTLRSWARERVRVYRGLGAIVEGGPKVRK